MHGDKPSSLLDLPIDGNVSANKPPVPVRTSPLWNEIMPQFNPFNLINPMNVMDSAMFMGQVSINYIYLDVNDLNVSFKVWCHGRYANNTSLNDC